MSKRKQMMGTEEDGKRTRKQDFTNKEMDVIAEKYLENFEFFSSKGTKASANSRRSETWKAMAVALRAQFPKLVPRGVKEFKEKVKNMFKAVKRLPHVKKVNPTGGGSPLSPLPSAWQRIFVDILRDDTATQGLAAGIDSDMPQRWAWVRGDHTPPIARRPTLLCWIWTCRISAGWIC